VRANCGGESDALSFTCAALRVETRIGFWAPDGAYALISQIVLFAWIAVLSGFLVMRSPSPVTAPDRAAVSAP
jgi:hypothetical protein